MRKSKKISGFTLVEVLVAVAITSIFAGVITGVFISARNAFISNSAALEVHGANRLAMDWIVRDIKWANQTVPSVTISGTTYTTGINRLVLSVPGIDASGDIIEGVFDAVVYALNGTDLIRVVSPNAVSGSGSNRLASNYTIANNVNMLQFALNADNIGITVNTRRTVLNSRVLSDTLTTAVSFRNE